MNARTDFAEVLVVGTFRSGTNLMKYLLEQNFRVRCSFNGLGWKHALAPTWASPSGRVRPLAPLIVMVKEPVRQSVSYFDHWSRTRPGLVSNRSFSQFIRSEFLVHDNSHGGKGPKYLFPTPADYWNQFYFSYLFWEEMAPRQQLVRLEQLEADPRTVLLHLAAKLSLPRIERFEPSIPANRVVPTPEGYPALLHASERQPSGTDQVSAEDRAFIASRISPLVTAGIYPEQRQPSV